jgi:hypothetical protein
MCIVKSGSCNGILIECRSSRKLAEPHDGFLAGHSHEAELHSILGHRSSILHSSNTITS